MVKKQQRMQAEWRIVDAKWKEKLQEAKDEAEESDQAEDLQTPMPTNGRKRSTAKKDDDPWAQLRKARKAQPVGPTGLTGLHDVVAAPPTFTTTPKEKFKVFQNAKVDVLNVPASAGSLRKR